MTATRAYLDHNASAPLVPAAREAMVAALEIAGNPSSVHREGRALRQMIDRARRDVASLVGAEPAHVWFTSGATEAASWLLTPDWRMGRAPLKVSRLIVSAADHPCILGGGRFAAGDVTVIGVDRNGVVDMVGLEGELAAHDRNTGLVLVAVHAANNETGVVQPIPAIAGLVKSHGGLLVVDAVQAAGRVSIDMSAGYGDFLILSSHKIGGPKGAGAVVGISDLMMPAPLVRGGGQEKGHRSGTENVAAIAGFGAAARIAHAGLGASERMRARRDGIEMMVRQLAPDAVFHGVGAERLCNTSFFEIPGLNAETAQIAFDLAGVALSAGSACSSGKVGPSHVLRAMGFGDDASALRVSIGHDTGDAEVEAFTVALKAHLARRAPGSAAA